MDREKWYVYCHTSPNGKKYIGITSRSPETRWENGKGYKANKHFSSAINKYGWENFKHKILLEVFSKDDACDAEKRFIEEFDSANPKKGYNKTLGGESGVKHTDEVKKRISKFAQIRWEDPIYKEKMRQKNVGRKHSEATKEKMRIAHLAENLTKEQRERMSAANKGRKYPNRRGHLHTEEAKKKISESKKGKHFGGIGKKPKKIVCVETNHIYDSVKSASEILKADKSSIYKCCKGERETAKKFHWKFLDVYMAEKP